MNLTKLKENNNNLYITSKKDFIPITQFKNKTIEMTFQFAYDMSFGKSGEHRNHRSGGTHARKNGEIFANTFQGKLSEFAVYNALYKHCDIQIPDLSTYGLGEWDSYDFEINDKKISVKSTKSFGNLLLLETKDWNINGQYIPNMSKGDYDYDVFILVRIKPYCEDLLKRMKSLYSNDVNREELFKVIMNQEWKYDIPGFIRNQDLIYAITNKHIIKQGQMLNGKTKMDAENYYIQSGDMYDLEKLVDILK